MSKKPESSTVDLSHLLTFAQIWDTVGWGCSEEITSFVGATVDEINIWARKPGKRNDIRFWIATYFFKTRGRLCREGATSVKMRKVLDFLSKNRGRFDEVLEVLDISKRTFFHILKNNQDLTPDEEEVFDAFVERERSQVDTPERLTEELMEHLRAMLPVVVRCNGHTPRVIELLGEQDREVIDPIRALFVGGEE